MPKERVCSFSFNVAQGLEAEEELQHRGKEFTNSALAHRGITKMTQWNTNGSTEEEARNAKVKLLGCTSRLQWGHREIGDVQDGA
jgi:hypothetical protein